MAIEDIWGSEAAQSYNNLNHAQEEGVQNALVLPGKIAAQQGENALTQQRVQASALENDQTAAMNPLKLQSAQIGLQQEKQRGEEATRGFYERQIADTVKDIDPNDPKFSDKWDAAMSSLDSQGNRLAKQYIGHATANAPSQVAALYGGAGPESPLAAIGRSQALAPGAGMPITGEPQVTKEQLQALPPQQFSVVAAHATAYKNAIAAVEGAKDPGAAWDQQMDILAADPATLPAVRQGLINLKGHYSPALLTQIKKEEMPVIQATADEAARRGANLPKAPLESKTETSPGGGVTMQVKNPDGTWSASRILSGNQWQLVGTDPTTGVGIYHNTETNQEARGTAPLGAKPGTNKVFSVDEKKAMWLQVHPGDQQGALDYASGKKQMAPNAAMATAFARAEQEASQAALSGKTMTPEQIDTRAAEIQQQILADQAGGSPAGPAAAPPAPPAGGQWPIATVGAVNMLKSRLAAKGANAAQERALFDQKFGPGASQRFVR